MPQAANLGPLLYLIFMDYYIGHEWRKADKHKRCSIATFVRRLIFIKFFYKIDIRLSRKNTVLDLVVMSDVKNYSLQST